MIPNVEFHIFTIHYEPPKRGHPLYIGQDASFQGDLLLLRFHCTPVLIIIMFIV